MTQLFNKRFACTCLMLFSFNSVSKAQANTDWELSINPAWSSKYVSEGRNNLDSGGLFSLDLRTSWRQLTLGGWFANGDTESYQEIDLYIEYGYEFYSIEGYLKYTRLEFPKDGEHDNELAAGFEYAQWKKIIPSVDYTWSSEASGGFLELSLSSKIDIKSNGLIFMPYLTQAFDFGYVTSDYDGPNNIQVGMEAIMRLNDDAHIGLNANHSWGQGDVERDDMDNVTWFGIGLYVGL